MLLLVVASCKKEDDRVFSEPASQRALKLVDELKAVITKPSNGWHMTLYTKDYEYGGYNVLVKFDEAGYVEAADELQEDFSLRSKSVYSYNLSDGAGIGFTTFNPSIHRYSEPNSSLFSKSLKFGGGSDFLFNISEVSEQRIVLKGLRDNITLELTPMLEDKSWEDYLNEIKSVRDRADFSKVEVIFKGKTYRSSPESPAWHAFTVSDEDGNTFKLPYSYSTTGLVFPQDYEFDGVSNLPPVILQEARPDGEIPLVSADESLAITSLNPTVRDFIDATLWFPSKQNMGSFGQTALDAASSTAARSEDLAGVNLYIVATFGSDTEGGGFGIWYVSNWFSTWLYFPLEILEPEDPAQGDIGFRFVPNYEPGGNTQRFMVTESDKSQIGALALPFAHMGSAIKGYRDTTAPRYFRAEMDNPRRPTWIKLTDVDSPDNWIKLTTNQPQGSPFE